MERAFEAARCDWRVITVEVQPENFQIALEGMRAMAFTALRFFPELQSLARSLAFDQPLSECATITSAMRTTEGAEDRWDYWDNQGFGMLDLIQRSAPAASTLVWLHGHSRMTQSLFDAMHTSRYSPSHLIWSEGPSRSETPHTPAQDALVSNTAVSSTIVSNNLVADTLTAKTVSMTETAEVLQAAVSQANLTHFVVVGESLAAQLPVISQLTTATELQLVIATNQLLTRQQVNDAWSKGRTTILPENEQLIAAEAYDFRRWTGQQADLDLLRDAYDEYADF